MVTTTEKSAAAVTPERRDGVETLSWIFMAALACIPIYMLFQAEDWSLIGDRVLRTQAIGTFVRMSGPGGLLAEYTIETDQGFYPLLDRARISKGTPLILETRTSNAHYICDVPRKLCLRTTRDGFSQPQSDKATQTN